QQGSESRGFRWIDKILTLDLCRHHASDHQADRRTFDIAFTAGNLSGKADMRRFYQAHFLVEQLGRIDERVAMQSAKSSELSIFQTGDRAQQIRLGTIFQLRLEPDHVP